MSYIQQQQLFNTGFIHTPTGFRERQGLASQNISSACAPKQSQNASYNLYPVNLPKVNYNEAGNVPHGCPCLSNSKPA